MKKRKLTIREQLGVLKKKEIGYAIAGLVFSLTLIGAVPAVFWAGSDFSRKIDNFNYKNGYKTYVTKILADYEKQYLNGEIPRRIYDSYVNYYNGQDAAREYYMSNGDEKILSEYDGLIKTRLSVLIPIAASTLVSIAGAISCFAVSDSCSNKIEEAKGDELYYKSHSSLEYDISQFTFPKEKVDDENSDEK